MTSIHRKLETMGKEIADVEDRLLAQSDRLPAVKRRMVFDPSAYPKRTNRSVPFIAGGVAAAAAVVLIVVFVGLPSDLTVRTDGRTLEEGGWISSTTNKPTSLRFSDGSSFRLEPKSGIRVAELHADGARLLLERGTVEANVVHTPETDWRLDVGPYLVTITGTRFTVGWDPETEAFSLDMNEGSVHVQGPMISEGKTVRGQERMRASLKERRLTFFDGQTQDETVSAAPSDTTAKEPIAPPVGSNDEAHPTPSSDDTTSGDSASAPRCLGPKAPRVPVSWQTLAEQGRYKEALSSARRTGLEKITTTAGSSDLLMLGDAARHTGDLSMAAKLYRKVRQRFPGSAQASSAAFALGLIAFDKRGAYREAASWFKAIVSERSGQGSLAKEAAGRLMESLQRAGDAAGAGEAARRYLARYPKGPHAPLANRLTK